MGKSLAVKGIGKNSPRRSGVPLEEALTKFEGYLRMEGYAPRTVGSYLFDLDHFVRWLETREILDVGNLAMPPLSEYQSVLATEPGQGGKIRTAGTRAHILAAIVAFGRFLLKAGILDRNPFDGVSMPRPPRKLPNNVLTIREMTLLLAAPDLGTPYGLRDRALMELLYATGLRQSEALDLAFGDVDLGATEVRVVRGKGGDGRIVPLLRETVGVLSAYVADARPALASRSDSGHFFLSCRGRRPDPSQLLKIMKRYAAQAGIRKRVGFHTFRHSCATHLMQRRAGLRYIQELLGHRSITTTQIYTKVSITDLKAAHAKYHPREKMEV